jgi:FAD/FMN-containing dehydrogenase
MTERDVQCRIGCFKAGAALGCHEWRAHGSSPVARTRRLRAQQNRHAGRHRGARNYWKSSFLAELSDEAIDALIAQFAVCPSPMSGLVLEHFHGAATRVGVGETAFAQRRESYNLMVVSQWLDPKDDEKSIAWGRATYDVLRPHMARESYANYQTEDETEGASEQAYGPNYERLVALKNKLDPTNLFHLNHNVRPTV